MRKGEKSTGRPSLHAVKVTDEPKAGAPAGVVAPDPEVPAKAKRRTYTAEFKRQVLAEVDAATEPGEIGMILRRNGLYSSHLADWRRQRDAGELAGLAPRKRGRKPMARNPLAEENAKLQRELARATARAERAERLLELQKKVAELFGETLPPPPPELAPPEESPKRRPRTRRRR
jgi:transposase